MDPWIFFWVHDKSGTILLSVYFLMCKYVFWMLMNNVRRIQLSTPEMEVIWMKAQMFCKSYLSLEKGNWFQTDEVIVYLM